jgi:hypothetical protein
VTARGDDDADMTHRSPRLPRSRELDDAAIDAIVLGSPVDAGHDRLATFARLVRTALLDVPDPHPSPELSRLLRGTPSPAPRPPCARRVAGPAARVAGLGLLAKIGLGASLAAASVTGAGAAGVLRAPARDAVRAAIETVTPSTSAARMPASPPHGSRSDPRPRRRPRSRWRRPGEISASTRTTPPSMGRSRPTRPGGTEPVNGPASGAGAGGG